MRAFPHRVATASAVTFGDPELLLGGERFTVGEPVTPWDYLAPSVVVSTASVDEAEFLRSTGLTELSGVVGHLQVDCPTTGSRHSANAPLPADGETVAIEVHLPPHEVAQRIEVTQSVLLDRPDGEEPPDLAAYRRGSRLWQAERTFRFILEGSASTFPTEAFDFGPAGLPPTAAWKLQFEPDSLDEPYLGAVRLFINSEHPQASELLSGRPSIVQSVLFHDIVQQLLTAVSDRFSGEVHMDFEADSVGEALNHLATTYLGVTLAAAATRLREDRAETLCRLQAGTSFLLEGRS